MATKTGKPLALLNRLLSAINPGGSLVTNPVQFDDSNKLITSSWIKQNGVAYRAVPILSANTTLDLTHVGSMLALAGVGSLAATLPVASSVPAGTTLEFHHVGAGTWTVQRQGTDLIEVSTSQIISLTLLAGDSLKLVSTGAIWKAIGGSAQLFYATGAPILGLNQTWQDVTGSRALATTYTNSTGRSILVNVACTTTSGIQMQLITEGLTIIGSGENVVGSSVAITVLIRPGQTYNVPSAGKTLTSWRELR